MKNRIVHPKQAALALVAVLLAVPTAQAQDCEPAWSSVGSGVSDPVGGGAVALGIWALAVFDDGSGPALYAGGSFTNAGGIEANRIARWDGSSWSALGSGVTGSQGQFQAVLALAVFDDGSGPALYAGGTFTQAGGIPANGIAKWDGSSWSPLGDGVTNSNIYSVIALQVFDDGTGPALYAGGQFTHAGGKPAVGIARWDGSTWSALGSGIGTASNSFVEALAVFDDGTGPGLYAGGAFTQADGAPGNRIARWDGSTWSPLGLGVNLQVRSLKVFDDGSGQALFVGGFFSQAGGSPASKIARWDGSSWAPLGSGVDNIVSSLAVFDDGSGQSLYAGGLFSVAGNSPANRVARWNGSLWSAMESGLMSGNITTLTVFDEGSGLGLYAGGDFNIAGGAPANNIARWGCILPCIADLDDNDTLNFFDIAAFLAFYQIQFPSADWNGDGVLNFFDFAGYLDAYNTGCP
jgi:hypothetical protein